MAASSPTSDRAPRKVDNVRGAIWMLGGSMTLAISSMGVKLLSHLPLLQIAFMRAATALIVLAPFIFRNGWKVFRTNKMSLHFARITFSSASMTASIYSLAHLQLGTAVSLGFTRPLFMIIIAFVILHEKVGWRRGVATMVGFMGVLVIMGPMHMTSMPGILAALGGAACYSVTTAVIRKQTGYDSPDTIICWVTTGICISLMIPGYMVWQAPLPRDWMVAGVLGITGAVSQYMIIRAYTYGEATVLNPIDYSQIILTTFAGYFLFGEVPSLWTVAGVMIIVASTLYIVLREARKKIEHVTVPDLEAGATPEV